VFGVYALGVYCTGNVDGMTGGSCGILCCSVF
jgi:hypothetical protein